jgi:DNA repair exonuclease SbcCD ATPase subunit
MKEFIIKEIVLSNFKGQSRTFTPNDVRTFVKGANGVGKTTLYKAFCWLLTSYTDALNVKNHELFDSRLELTHETPEARVKATILLDGEEYTIERVAKAKFSRKRGSQEWTKDASDSYCLYIDNIETSATAFNSWLERNIGNVDLIPYMLLGERFANLVIDDKKAARKILEQITGEITIDMMHGDYSMIKKDLQKYPIEQLLERYKAQLKPLVQRISVIDALIETKENELSPFNEVDFDSLLLRIDEKTKELTKVDECIADASKLLEPLICERERIIKEIHAKSVELGDARFKFEGAKSEELMALMSEIQDVDRQNQDIKKSNKKREEEYEIALATFSAKKKLLEKLNDQRDSLIKKRDNVKARVFNGERCEYCGNLLSEHDVEEQRKAFNEYKESELNCIVTEGKIIKSKIDEVNKEISGLSEIISIGCQLEAYKDKDELVKKYEALKSSQKTFEETDTYRKIDEEINELKNRMPEIKNDTNDLSSTKERLMGELQSLNREYGKKAVKDGFEREIELLKIEKRNLGSEIVRLEGLIDTIKEYEEERARIISDKINNKLDDCRIVMYSRQKDGTLKPDCVVESKEGVKYATLNNSARIRICLSLQRMFCKHFDINLPIFVDEASVFDSEHLPTFESQTIYLLASDDKTLKVE